MTKSDLECLVRHYVVLLERAVTGARTGEPPNWDSAKAYITKIIGLMIERELMGDKVR